MRNILIFIGVFILMNQTTFGQVFNQEQILFIEDAVMLIKNDTAPEIKKLLN